MKHFLTLKDKAQTHSQVTAEMLVVVARKAPSVFLVELDLELFVGVPTEH